MANVFAYPPTSALYTRTVVNGREYLGIAYRAAVIDNTFDTAELTAAGWTIGGATNLPLTRQTLIGLVGSYFVPGPPAHGNATFPVVTGVVFDIFGDSRSAYASLAPPVTTNNVYNGYPQFAIEAGGFKAIFADGGNFGVAGNTLQQMVARLSSLGTTNARICVFLGGVNDGSEDISVSSPLYEQIFAKMSAVYDAFIVCNEYPHTGLTSTQLSSQLARIAYLSDPSLKTRWPKAIQVDTFHALLDPNSATGCDYKAGYSLDGLHAAVLGNQAVGAVLGPVFSGLLTPYPSLMRLPVTGSAPYNAATNPTGYLLDNFLLTGTGGSLGGGATGTLPNDWNMNAGSNAGLTVVCSKGTDPDGYNDITITVSGTSPSSTNAMILYNNNASVAAYMAAMASNGKAYALCRFRVGAGQQGLLGPGIELAVAATISGNYVSNRSYNLLGQAGVPYLGTDDDIESPLVTIPAGWEGGTGRQIQPFINLAVAASATVNFTVHISRFGILKYS